MHEIASTTAALVVKYGGSALQAGGPDPVLDELAELHRAGRRVVVVHGGGADIDRALARRRIATKRVGGLRVTRAAALEVTEAVLCASVNKRVVRALLRRGARAAGLCGQDGATLIAERMRSDAELGYVGQVVQTQTRLLETLMAGDFIPVVAPLAVSHGAEHALNVNADAAAAAIAIALRARALILITDVSRVLRDPSDPASALQRLTLDEAIAFSAGPACRDGMRPKLEAAVAYVASSIGSAFICRAKAGSIAAALSGDATVIG